MQINSSFLLAELDSFSTADAVKERYLAAGALLFAAADRIRELHARLEKLEEYIDYLESIPTV